MTAPLRRVFTGFVWFLVVVVLAIWAGSAIVVSLQSARIAQTIEQSLGPGFEVGSVSGDIVRGLLIEGVAASADPASGSSTDPILQAAKCRLTPDYLALFQGNMAIQEVAFSDVTITLRRDEHGSLVWPPFIQRAATAQGATLTLSAFHWTLARAEMVYFATPDSAPLRAQVPSARGRFVPGGVFQIESCSGTLSDAAWELALTLDQSDKSLSGIWKLREAGVWTLTQALTGHRDMRLDAAVLPTGIVSGALNIGGTLSDPELKGTLDWREGTLRHFRIEQGEMKLAWRPGKLTFSESVVKAYNGRLAADGAIDFRAQPPHYEFHATTEQMELGEFLNDAGFGKIHLTGQFAGEFEGQGQLHDLASFQGTGHVTAADGQTKNPLYDPNDPNSKEIVDYTSLVTDLTIRREQLRIANGKMVGKDMSLAGGGQVDFSGDLNLAATLTAPGRLFENHPTYGLAVQALQMQDSPVGLNLDVRGTLAEPDVRVTVDPATIREAAQKGLMGRIRDFFKGGNSNESNASPDAPQGE